MSVALILDVVLVSSAAAFISSPLQRFVIFVFLLIAELYNLWMLPNGPIPAFDYATGTSIMSAILYACDLLVLTPEPLASLRLRSEREGKPIEPTFISNHQKFWWTVAATQSPRRINRISQASNVPPFHESTSHTIFIRNRLAKLIFYIVPLLLLNRYILLFMGWDVREWKHGPGLLGRWTVVHIAAYTIYLVISTAYMTASIFLVTFNISNPEDWPPLFGSFKHTNSLRGFWSKTWHQMLQKMLTSFGRTIAQGFLRFPRGSSRSSFTKLCTGFALSALVHSAGDFALTRGEYWFSWRFFFLQVIGITLEDRVIALWKRTGLGNHIWSARIGKLLGYVWTSLWFTATFPSFLGGFEVAFRVREERLARQSS